MRRWVIGSAVTAMMVAATTVIVAGAYRDEIRRHYHLSRLCSDDARVQRRSLAWLAGRTGDARIADHAAQRLNEADEDCFDAAVEYLSSAGRWGAWAGPAWVRYLTRRAVTAAAPQRAALAAELGRMLWLRRPLHDDPRIIPAVARLLEDPDADVRLNALSAAACIGDPQRDALLDTAAHDPHPQVAGRAARLRMILRGEGPPPAGGRADVTDPALALLAEFESLPTSSKPVALSRDMPPLLRVQAVRVSTGSAPEELVPVFNSDQPTLRDLACLVAIERFTAPQCRALAATLLGSFHNSERMAGAMLAGLTDESRDDEELLARLRRRAESPGSWIVQQHCYIALAMLDRPVPGFDPLPLLQHRAMPRTTLNMALMHTGRLEGLDWLLSPFGDPPVGGVEGLRLLLDYLRYDHVLRRYLPELPPFSLWADPAMQRLQVEWIRDWYLVHRPGLRFDARSRTFRGAGDG